MSSFRAALREELRPKSLLLLAATGAVLLAVTDVSAAYLAYLGALAILGAAGAATLDAEVVDRRLAQASLGVLIGLAAVAWIVGRTLAGEPAVLPAAALLVGLWIAVDGFASYRADFRSEAENPLGREPGAAETMRLMRRAHDAYHALDDEDPRTVAEVAAETDTDPAAVAEVLDVCESQGMVHRREGGYVANPAYRGRWRSTATNLRALGRRLARPVLLLTGR